MKLINYCVFKNEKKTKIDEIKIVKAERKISKNIAGAIKHFITEKDIVIT